MQRYVSPGRVTHRCKHRVARKISGESLWKEPTNVTQSELRQHWFRGHCGNSLTTHRKVCRGRSANEHSRILADFRLHVLQPPPQKNRRFRGAAQKMRRRRGSAARYQRYSQLHRRRSSIGSWDRNGAKLIQLVPNAGLTAQPHQERGCKPGVRAAPKVRVPATSPARSANCLTSHN